MDYIAFNLFIREIRDKLTGSPLQKIFEPDTFESVFRFRLPGENLFLFVSLKPGEERIHPIPGKFSESNLPSPFCMMLRKHIESARVLSVSQEGKDRILRMKFGRTVYDEESGEKKTGEKNLYIELTGKTSNIVLCDHQNRVIGAFNRKDSHRDFTTGQPYSPPIPPHRYGPMSVSRAEFLSLMEEERFKSLTPKDFLMSCFMGMSKELAEEILYPVHVPASAFIKEVTPLQIENLFYSFNEVMEKINNNRIEPVLYYNKEDADMENPPIAWSFLDLKTFEGYPCERVDSVSQALSGFYFLRTTTCKTGDLKKESLQALNKRIAKVKNRLQKQQQDLTSAQKTLEYKKFGELILSNIHNIPPQSELVEVMDYYQDPPRNIRIKLNPLLSASDNAQEYFRKYKKAHRGVDIIAERIRITQEELEELENHVYYVESSDNQEELEEILQELTHSGIYTPPQTPGRRRTPPKPSQPHKFVLDREYVALVGRNSRQNEELTMKIANKEDLWFHARQIPGSHVVLKIQKPSQPVPDQILYRCACLAGYYSKARLSAKVPVDYTRAKNVRKVKGMAPGRVLITGEKTIIATPSVPVPKADF